MGPLRDRRCAVNWLSSSLLSWTALAVLLFWFVGAHNRLVRLRSSAMQAYAALDPLILRQLEFVQASAAPIAEDGAAPDGSHAALLAAAGQALTVLAATRQKPLDPHAIGALGTALHVVVSAWQRLHPDDIVSFDADGILSRPASLAGLSEPGGVLSIAAVPMAWPEPSALVEITRAQFNTAVIQYNAAIRQFPALFVAWALRLRPAAALV